MACFSGECAWGGGKRTAADVYSAEEDGDDAVMALVSVSFTDGNDMGPGCSW